jgi:hypothetical protein
LDQSGHRTFSPINHQDAYIDTEFFLLTKNCAQL